METKTIKITDRGSAAWAWGISLWVLAFWGKPDLWDAIIFYLMQGQ